MCCVVLIGTWAAPDRRCTPRIPERGKVGCGNRPRVTGATLAGTTLIAENYRCDGVSHEDHMTTQVLSTEAVAFRNQDNILVFA
jgi:hypothetical protein